MKKKLLIAIVFVLLNSIVGCTSDKFDSYYKQFKESYIVATNFVEKDNDSLKVLKKMNVTTVETELKKMKEYMDEMSTMLNSKIENGVYNNVKSYYQGIDFLLYAAKNNDTLSTDDKIKVDAEVLSAIMNRKSIKQGEE